MQAMKVVNAEAKGTSGKKAAAMRAMKVRHAEAAGGGGARWSERELREPGTRYRSLADTPAAPVRGSLHSRRA